MGVKYLTAYAQSLGAPIVVDTLIAPFAPPADATTPTATTTTSNVVVLDASGGMARYLKPDESERSVFDFQDCFERVAVDMAALRALGYQAVVFLDAAIPSSKLPVWKQRRRAELNRQGKIAQALESPNFGEFGPPPPLPKNNWTPPEGAAQHLADAYAAAGCEVHFGLQDVDLEAAAYARKVRAFAVLTCDSDFYLTVGCRVWHYEHFDVDHGLWRRRGDPTWWPEDDDEGERDETEVWLPPAGSPGVKGETQKMATTGGWSSSRWWGRRLWPYGGKRAGGGGGKRGDDKRAPAAPPAILLPQISVREIRTDLLRERLQLSPRALPLLAACLGNDGIAHISRRQLEAIFAERPDLPPQTAGSALVAAALLADAGAACGGGGGGGNGGGGPPPPGSLLAPDGPGGGAPWRVVEILAHELSRQLAAGVISVGGVGGNDANAGDDDEAAVAAAAAAASARAAASNPRRQATARFVAHRATVYARAVRQAYDPASVLSGVAAPSAAPVAPAAAATAATAAAALTTPTSTITPTPAAPNVIRAVIARTGCLVKGMRADDVREPAAVAALRELRLRAYAGSGISHVRELLYHPVAVRPYVAPAVAAVAVAVAAGAGTEAGAASSSSAADGGGTGADANANAATPATTTDGPLGGPGRTGGFIWQEDFVDVDVQAELQALGNEKTPPPSPLLPSSPEIRAASKNGRAFAAFAARELLRLELITPVEAEILRRQASPRERARLRRRAGARLLGANGERWSGNGGVIACLRSLRVCALLLTVHTWVAVVLDNNGMPTIESCLDVRVFNELWRREVQRLEQEEQPRGAVQRRRWVREGAPPPLPEGEGEEGRVWYWLPQQVQQQQDGGGGAAAGVAKGAEMAALAVAV